MILRLIRQGGSKVTTHVMCMYRPVSYADFDLFLVVVHIQQESTLTR